MTPSRRANMILDPRVQAVLDGLRRRIRLYVWAQGLATAVACLGAAFWASLLVDWFFEPGWPVRVLLLAAVAVGVGIVLWRLVGRRALVRLSDGNMAMLLERRFPVLGDSLLTAVELADAPAEQAGYNETMLDRTAREASERITQVRPGAVFNPIPLRHSLLAAGAMAVSMAMLAGIAPWVMNTWARRSLLLAEELWPRQTRLEIVGFEGNVAKVAGGDAGAVRARADASMPLVPNTLQIRYRTEAGARGRRLMSREGNAVPGRDAFQEYSHKFQGILAPIDFELVGGDARLSGLRIEVVESPAVEQLVLRCEFPRYMARPPRALPLVGVMQIPVGTRVGLEGRANKDLVSVQIDSALNEPAAPPARIDVPASAADRRRFEYDLGKLVADRTLLVSLRDADGIRSRQPLRVAIAAVADEAPELPVELVGVGTAITPRARLPVRGHVTDDHGLARVWFECVVDKNPPSQVEIATPQGNSTDLSLEAALEVPPLAVQPGQKLQVGLKATDRRDLGEGPNTGSGQRWVLDVVTPERLQVMLQARELVLRQRFEMIIAEVIDTRDSLLRVEFEEATKPAEVTATPSGGEPNGKPGKEWGREPGDEPGEEPAARETASPERQAALRSLRCERAVENCRKNAQETLAVAEAFDDLRLQLINNRIDTEELKRRLGSGIAEPLRAIAGESFGEFEKRLVALRGVLVDRARGPAARDAARQQADAILLAMKEVLGRMIELEDFNEVIAILEEIIRSQESLGKEAQRRHKALLKDLLED